MNQPHDEDLARAQAALQQMTNGYWTTQIIYVAAKLGIADLLSHGPQDVDTLARATQTHAPSLGRLMRADAAGDPFPRDRERRGRRQRRVHRVDDAVLEDHATNSSQR